jgi:NitT/TauT family transport system substrate-binding protein
LKKFTLIICFSILFSLQIKDVVTGEENPIRIGYLQSDIHQLACWVAMEKGFYEKNGANAQVAGIFKAGPEEMSAFAAGALDMGYVGEAPATTAVANRVAKATVLAQVNTEGSAIMVKKGSPIQKPADLAGKTIAIPGHSTVQDFLLQKALRKFKVDPKKVPIIVLKPPEMIGALKTGQIDGFIAWEPYPAKAQTMGVGQVLLTSNQIWKDHPCCVLIADDGFRKLRPRDVEGVVKAHVEATDFIQEYPDEAVKIGMKYTGMDEETVRTAMKNVNYTYELSIDGETEYVDFLSRLKYIDVPHAEIFVNRFIDPGVLEKVVGKQ